MGTIVVGKSNGLYFESKLFLSLPPSLLSFSRRQFCSIVTHVAPS
jgi:hypothetical protein